MMSSHSILVNAIQQKVIIVFTYEDKLREVEPYVYGINEAGHEVLSAYQVDGESRSKLPDWKTFHVDKMIGLHLTTYPIHPAGRGYNPNDKLFKTIFAKIT
jgi:hypothetical protein